MSEMGIYIIRQECISCHEIKGTDEFGICRKCWEWHENERIKEYPNIFYRNKKQTIPAKIRWEVWERDNFTCQKCGIRKNLTIDHIVPESKGGQLTMDNTQTLCKSCNSLKGAR